MRRARIKPDQQDHYYHVYNRIAGLPCELPFGRPEKERFLQILHRLAQYYVIEVISYQVMSNHYHLVVHVPVDLPSHEEVCNRYQQYYAGKRILYPESEKCKELRYMLRDLSCFMHDLQQQFATWFNKTRGAGRRRGTLWADRFKSTLLEKGPAVRACTIYVQMNPVRAGMVQDPADYRFGSWGYWSAMKHHPFQESAEEYLMPCFLDILPDTNSKKVFGFLKGYYKWLCEREGARAEEDTTPCFSMQMDRRVRYWAEGLAIGSELFVLDALAEIRGKENVTQAELIKAGAEESGEYALWSYPQLRYVSG